MGAPLASPPCRWASTGRNVDDAYASPFAVSKSQCGPSKPHVSPCAATRGITCVSSNLGGRQHGRVSPTPARSQMPTPTAKHVLRTSSLLGTYEVVTGLPSRVAHTLSAQGAPGGLDRVPFQATVVAGRPCGGDALELALEELRRAKSDLVMTGCH